MDYQKADIEKLENKVEENDQNTEFYVHSLQARARTLEEALSEMKVLMETVKADNDDLRRRMVALEATKSQPRRSVRLREARG